MEVLHEIIRYLNGRHLTPEDLLYLRRNGFIDYIQELELREAHPLEEPADISPEDLEPDLEDQLLPGPRVGKSGRRKWRRTRLRPDVLGQRILAQWPAWQPSLQPLTTIAMQLGAPRSLEDALRVIRHAEPAALDAVVRSLLAGTGTALPALWPAIAFDAYWDGIVATGEYGPEVKAFDAILQGRQRGDMGAYGSALRHPGFARLYALVQAQCAILTALRRVIVAEPLLLDRPLFRRSYEASCYWALTFIVSAIDIEQDGFPVHLHAPRRPYPSPAAEAAAVRAVARMAPRLMQQLLATDVDEFVAVLRCPCRWDQFYFNHENDKGRMA